MDNKTYWHKDTRDIVDEIVSIDGLYKKVFGDLLDGLVYDRQINNNVELLEKVYWFDKVEEIFWPVINRTEFRKLSKIIFRFYEQKQGMLWNNDK